MRHPKRLLQEYLDGQATPRDAADVRAHLARCADCRAEAARERRLRSRLRALEVPAANPELRDRLAQSARRAADAGADGYAAAAGPAGPAAPSRRRRRLLTAAGAMAAAAGLVLSAAYLLGSWSHGNTLSEAAPGLAAGWTEVTGGGTGNLSADQIVNLRTRGWACPELRSIGMSLVAARSDRIDGQPAVVMTLEGKGSTVTVYETRPASLAGSNDSLVEGMSGQPVSEQGFVLQEQDPGRPQIWLHPEHPDKAVLAASRVTYTVQAEPPGDVLDAAVDEISLTESSRLVLHTPDNAQGLWDRIQRGLGLMTGTGNSR